MHQLVKSKEAQIKREAAVLLKECEELKQEWIVQKSSS
jgi:hypothetical protein